MLVKYQTLNYLVIYKQNQKIMPDQQSNQAIYVPYENLNSQPAFIAHFTVILFSEQCLMFECIANSLDTFYKT